jgi:hypothetical protein
MTLTSRVTAPDLAALPDWQVADILNTPDLSLPAVLTLEKTLVGFGDVMRVLGPEAGAGFLDAVEKLSATMPTLKWALRIMAADGINTADSVARGQIDSLVAAKLLTAAQGNALKATAERRRFPSWAEHNGVEVTARTVGLARGAKE